MLNKFIVPAGLDAEQLCVQASPVSPHLWHFFVWPPIGGMLQCSWCWTTLCSGTISKSPSVEIFCMTTNMWMRSDHGMWWQVPPAVDTGVHDCNCMTCFLRMLFSLGVYASLSRRVQLVIIGWQLRPSHTHCSKRSLAAGGVNLDTTPFTYSWLMNSC